MTNVSINGKDARTTWGIVFDSASISALMTPPPTKELIENSSRTENGKRVIIDGVKTNERDVTLTFALYANDEEAFFERYDSFCEELAGGRIDIIVGTRPGIVYRCIYKSCSQFTQYNNRLANFTLKLNEPNPRDRSL